MATSAADRVHAHVKTRVLDGTYAGGDLLNEGAIAAEVGCSRTPVREALLRLESEGMLRLYPKKGALVVPVSAAEAADVWEARALVESWAAPRAYQRRDEVVERLGELTEQMRRCLADDDPASFSATDRAYHEVIVEAAGNGVLSRLYRGLRERQVLINTATMRVSRSRMERALADHAELLARLEADDLDGFVTLSRTHLDDARVTLSAGGLA